MTRVEIIGNVELLIDLEKALFEKFPLQFYTITPVLRGYGKKGFASGDDVWPESNFYCFMYVDELKTSLLDLKKVIDEIQRLSPQNSLKFFATKIEFIELDV